MELFILHLPYTPQIWRSNILNHLRILANDAGVVYVCTLFLFLSHFLLHLLTCFSSYCSFINLMLLWWCPCFFLAWSSRLARPTLGTFISNLVVASVAGVTFNAIDAIGACKRCLQYLPRSRAWSRLIGTNCANYCLEWHSMCQIKLVHKNACSAGGSLL